MKWLAQLVVAVVVLTTPPSASAQGWKSKKA